MIMINCRPLNNRRDIERATSRHSKWGCLYLLLMYIWPTSSSHLWGNKQTSAVERVVAHGPFHLMWCVISLAIFPISLQPAYSYGKCFCFREKLFSEVSCIVVCFAFVRSFQWKCSREVCEQFMCDFSSVCGVFWYEANLSHLCCWCWKDFWV